MPVLPAVSAVSDVSAVTIAVNIAVSDVSIAVSDASTVSAVSIAVSRSDASRVESPLCVVTTAHGATATASILYSVQNSQESKFWQEKPDFGVLTSEARILNSCKFAPLSYEHIGSTKPTEGEPSILALFKAFLMQTFSEGIIGICNCFDNIYFRECMIDSL